MFERYPPYQCVLLYGNVCATVGALQLEYKDLPYKAGTPNPGIFTNNPRCVIENLNRTLRVLL